MSGTRYQQHLFTISTRDVFKSALIPIFLPPIGMSDHSSILLQPSSTAATNHSSTRVLKRLSRPSNKQALSSSLSHTNWYPLYCATSTQEKFNIFSNILSDNMDIHLPLRSVKHNLVDKPWINHDIKDAITKRQHAWVKGNDTTIQRYIRNIHFIVIKSESCASESAAHSTILWSNIHKTLIL